MKIQIRYFALSLLAFSGGVLGAELSNRIPLWDQVDSLVCAGKKMFACTELIGCKDYESSAIWNIDFSDMEIEFLTMDYDLQIRDTHFTFYEPSNGSVHTIFLGDGRIMNFDLDTPMENKLGDIQAVTSSVTWDSNGVLTSSNTEYECYVQ